jgi:hypothetical protein
MFGTYISSFSLEKRKNKLVGNNSAGRGSKRKHDDLGVLVVEEPSDDVMAMKLVEIVYNQALKAIPEENRGGELIFVSALQKES